MEAQSCALAIIDDIIPLAFPDGQVDPPRVMLGVSEERCDMGAEVPSGRVIETE
jgi:hypothetical protein